MVVQHVNVAEGGQAIVGNVSTPAPGVRVAEKAKEQPLALAYAPGVEMPRPIEAERASCRAPAVRGLASVGCMAPVAGLPRQ